MIYEITLWAHNRPTVIGYKFKTTTFNPGGLVADKNKQVVLKRP